jgi:hypothetical protein
MLAPPTSVQYAFARHEVSSRQLFTQLSPPPPKPAISCRATH